MKEAKSYVFIVQPVVCDGVLRLTVEPAIRRDNLSLPQYFLMYTVLEPAVTDMCLPSGGRGPSHTQTQNW